MVEVHQQRHSGSPDSLCRDWGNPQGINDLDYSATNIQRIVHWIHHPNVWLANDLVSLSEEAKNPTSWVSSQTRSCLSSLLFYSWYGSNVQKCIPVVRSHDICFTKQLFWTFVRLPRLDTFRKNNVHLHARTLYAETFGQFQAESVHMLICCQRRKGSHRCLSRKICPSWKQ